jgi:Zn-dependent protease with chaperone function
MLARLSAIAALAMLGAYYLIAIAGPPAVVIGFVVTDAYADLRPLLIVGGFMTTVLILVPILIPVRTEREPGITVDRAREVALWQMVTEVAEATGSRPPGQLLLTPFARASASEETRWFGFVGRVQVLYLGLPLIETLTVDQLRAVVAHELGHHTHRHTRLLAIVYQGSMTFRRTGDILVRSSGFRKFGILFALAWIVHRIYLSIYEALSITALRHQEYEADREMVEICGRAGAATALSESVLAIRAWSRCWDLYVEPALMCRRAPYDLYGGLHKLLADPAMTTWCEKIRSAPPDDHRRFLDTHPSLADRLKAIERCTRESRTGS